MNNKILFLKDIPEDIQFSDRIQSSLGTLKGYWNYIFEKMDNDIDEEEYEEDDCVLLSVRDSEFLSICVNGIKEELEENEKYSNLYNKVKDAIRTTYIKDIEKDLVEAYEKANEDNPNNPVTCTNEEFDEQVENILVAGLAVIDLAFYLGYKDSYELLDLEKEDIDNPEFWINNFINRVICNTIYTDYL